MQIGFKADNKVDAQGNPAGGYVCGTGFTVSWQDGPLGRVGTDERTEPNGAFVEDLLDAVRQRLVFYQTASDGRFACEENARAIAAIEVALRALDERTHRRIARGVEGTHESD